jgi:hypothetical protein
MEPEAYSSFWLELTHLANQKVIDTLTAPALLKHTKNPFTEPIDKKQRDDFVQVEQTLMWICMNGGMTRAMEQLTMLRSSMEYDASC